MYEVLISILTLSNILAFLQCLFFLSSSLVIIKTLYKPSWLVETKLSIRRYYLPKVFELQRFIGLVIDYCYDDTYFDDYFYKKISKLVSEVDTLEFEWKSVGSDRPIQNIRQIYEAGMHVLGSLMQEAWLGKKGPKFYKRGKYKNQKNGIFEYYSSGFELDIMKKLDSDDNIVSWTKKHGIRISYILNRKKKVYIPDFLIDYKNGKMKLIEAKGRIYDKNVLEKKINAAQKYCMDNNIEFEIVYQK